MGLSLVVSAPAKKTADLSSGFFSTEESWAFGPPKVLKNASVQQPLSMNRRPLLVIPSEAEGSAVSSPGAE
jgi:hypothetical protein